METGETPKPAVLPENAYRELKPGETYVPIITQQAGIAEVSWRSVLFGSLMIVIFSAAATFIALKIGQGLETAIPISILAVGFSVLLKRRSTLLENINILALGATSGIIVGGSVFVMPAIFMLELGQGGGIATFLQIFMVPFLGAVMGVLFLIPFRRYFTHDMHGKLPFPEATATTEILVTGEKGGNQAIILLYSLGIGIVLDFMALAFRFWSDLFTTSVIPAFQQITSRYKTVFAMNTSSAVLGLGVIIGVRYSSIIMAGSMLSYFLLIPLFAHLSPLYASHTFTEIFSGFDDPTGQKIAGVRSIGIGGIFAAGVISIIKMSPVIVQAVRQVFSQLGRGLGAADAPERQNLDIPLPKVGGMMLALLAVLFAYFRFVVLPAEAGATVLALLAVLLTVAIVFLFSAVSAWAVAMISITPISGMTLTTLIISAVTLSALGLAGKSGMLAILLIGGVVCSALSMSGSLVTQFKIGHWLGATPSRIQWSNILGSALASLTVTAVMMLFAHIYGFGQPTALHADPLPAPQASAMAAVASAFLGGQGAPWILYAFGAAIAVVVSMLGVSALAFALGMYLPMELNSPLLAGALVGWLITWRAKDPEQAKERGNRSILIASGLIAGGALAGVLDGFLRLFNVDLAVTLDESFRNWCGLLVFSGLSLFLFFDARRTKSASK